MRQTSGSIEVITGSMFSGKTDELIRRLRRARIARQAVQVFKPSLDVRYGIGKLTSHAGSEFEATPVQEARSILERLPVRYDDNPYYFNDTFQALPVDGYTRMFENMLDHPGIDVLLNTDFSDVDGIPQSNQKPGVGYRDAIVSIIAACERSVEYRAAAS